MLNNIPFITRCAITHLASSVSEDGDIDTDHRCVGYLYHPWIKSKLVWINATKQDGRDQSSIAQGLVISIFGGCLEDACLKGWSDNDSAASGAKIRKLLYWRCS